MPFLVDSGAQIFLLSVTAAYRSTIPCKFILQVVNSSLIHTYVEKCIELNLGLCRTYTHIFIVTEVNSALLGIAFLQTFSLIIDLNGQCLKDPVAHIKACSVVKPGTPLCPTMAHANRDDAFLKSLKEYPSISVPSFHNEVLPHSIRHYIQNGPHNSKNRCLTPGKLKAARAEFQQMMTIGLT